MVDVEFRRFAHAEGARDDVPPRPGSRLVGTQDALVDKFLCLVVISRKLQDRTVLDKVDPAIARPNRRVVAFEYEQAAIVEPTTTPAPFSRAISLSRLLARKIRSSRRASRSGAEAGVPMDLSASVTVWLASAPSSWPPIPSATAQTPISGSPTKSSSL